MIALEVLLALAQILLPLSLAIPPVLAYVPGRETGTIIIFLYAPLLELWVTVWAIIDQLPLNMSTISSVTVVTAFFIAVLITAGYLRLGWLIVQWDRRRAVEAEA